MTAPTDREAALALLRERFPESEGYSFDIDMMDKPGWIFASVIHMRDNNPEMLSAETNRLYDTPLDAARALVASWDAATHAEQVRALVEAMREVAEMADARQDVLDGPDGQPVPDAWMNLSQRAHAALAALPASLRGKGGGAVNWKPCWKKPVQVEYREQQEGDGAVSTREGLTPLKPDDLIMRGVQGECYPIGRDIFEATYSLEPPPDIDALRAKLAEVTQERDDERESLAVLLDSCDPEEQAASDSGSEAPAIRINAAVCVHCGALIAQSGAGDAAVAAGFALMVEHDAQCEKHPGNVRAAAITAQLAASQARERELREALKLNVEFVFAQTERRVVEGLAARAGTSASAALSRPTDDSALRAVCERMVAAGRLQGMHDQQFVTGGYGRAEPGDSDARIVNEVLGPGAEPISAEIKEG